MSDLTYTSPLSRGFNRMKSLLFSPFHLVTWLTIGFASFLSQITQKLGESSASSEGDLDQPGDIFPWVSSTFEHFTDKIALAGSYIILASAVVFAIALLVLALAWLEARGKFIFLDNIVTGRGAISKPWSEYSREANSLFLWKLLIDIVLVFSIGLSVLFLGALIVPGVIARDLIPLSVAGIFIGLWIVLLMALAVAYLRLFIQDFIVPIMYKDRIPFGQAWSKFMALLRKRPGELLLYGLFVAVLWVGLSLALGILGMVTCCVGFIVVAIPYVGSVIMLPVHATYRAFSAEFLAQFGPEFDVWEGLENSEEDASALPATPPETPAD